jgi:hypothetical protein
MIAFIFFLSLMLVCYFSFTDWLDLSSNNLMGSIPSEIALLTNLSEYSLGAACLSCFIAL